MNPALAGRGGSERHWIIGKSDIVNSYVVPVFEGLGISLCFLIGIEVLTSSFWDTVITVDFVVRNCVHLNDVKNTVNETRR